MHETFLPFLVTDLLLQVYIDFYIPAIYLPGLHMESEYFSSP